MLKRDYSLIISEALEVIRGGGTVIYPTDTVWGIGCDATNPEAVEKVFAMKRRSDSKSLVLLASDLDMVARYVKRVPDMAIDLVEVNDVPMTLIYPDAICSPRPDDGGKPVPDKYKLAYNTVAVDGTVGIRIPLSDFCKELVFKLGRPIVSTSANISGQPTPQNFSEISEEILSAADYVVDKRLEAGATGRASQIIKIGLGGEVEIIRK